MKPIEDMTEEEMLEELKTWDDGAWEKFKQENYETISLGFKLDD
jgi:hypothetical protein